MSSFRRKRLFITSAVLVAAVVAVITGNLVRQHAIGRGLNQYAWERSYTERGLPIPKDGPREGLWGSRTSPKVPFPRIGWHEPPRDVPGLLAIDGQGLQHYRSKGTARFRVLILGSSVAFGAYASRIDTTYYNILGESLDRNGIPTDITVAAAGAWKSVQEVEALRLFIDQVRPDLVVFLDGLNDLTNGATATSLFGEKIATADGSPWTVLYSAHDYEQRVSAYLTNMQRAYAVCAGRGSDMLVVLQPSLTERERRTEIEDVILKASLQPHKSLAALQTSYETMRNGLLNLAHQQGSFHFCDCSRIFEEERETVFSDLWHFCDQGHHLLGRRMAFEIGQILQERKQGTGGP